MRCATLNLEKFTITIIIFKLGNKKEKFEIDLRAKTKPNPCLNKNDL